MSKEFAATGVVDNTANIAIMAGKLFALVASSARFRKKDFKPLNQVLKTYNCKVFHPDDRMELEISFHGKAMKTMVYIKIDAPDQLLLSGVRKQLKIITYHPSLYQPDYTQNSVDSPACESENPTK